MNTSPASDATKSSSPRARWVASLVLIGCAVYVCTVVAAAEVTPNYSHTRQLISELGQFGAPAEPWMSAMLVAVGLLVSVFSLELNSVTELDTRSGRLWLGALGGGLVLGGIFPCDPTCAPRTFSGWAHILTSMPATLGTIFAPHAFAAHMRSRGWNRPATRSAFFGLITFASLLAALLIFPIFDCRGLGQRIATIVPLAWVGSLALLVLWPPRHEHFPEGPGALRALRRMMGQRDILAAVQALTAQQGPIVGVNLLGRRFCVITDPELIEELFIRNDRSLRQWGLNLFEPVLGRGLLTSDGDLWRRQRRLLQPHFSKKRLQSCRGGIERLSLELLNEWSDGDSVEVHEAGLQVSARIANSILFGDDAQGLELVVTLAHEALMEHFERALRAPVPLWVPTRANRRVQGAVRALDHAIHGLVQKRRDEEDFGEDFLGTLLRSQLIHDDLDDKLIRDECVTILLAATETTAVVLSWTLYLLAQHPTSTEELAQAIDLEFAKRENPLANLGQNVPQLTNTIFESMRLYTPVWATGRTAVGDCFIGPYVLPVGTQIFTVPYLAHRDPTQFDAPMTFRPERWNRSPSCPHSGSAAARCHPFGVGPHKCIGADLAIEELSILLAMIVQRFHLELVERDNSPKEQASVTLRPRGGLHLRLRARVPTDADPKPQLDFPQGPQLELPSN